MIAALFLAGCETTPSSTMSNYEVANNVDQGHLTIIHSGSMSSVGKQSFYINDEKVATLKNGSYSTLALPTGSYVIEQREGFWTTDLSGRIPKSVFVEVDISKDNESYVHYSFSITSYRNSHSLTILNGVAYASPSRSGVAEKQIKVVSPDKAKTILKELVYIEKKKQ